jgi:hypothetical protein
MIDPEYTKDQIRRAKKLTRIIFSDGKTDPEAGFRRSTSYGVKTNTGIINLILSIAFNPKE